MDYQIASLLVRQHMSLMDEGIGPARPLDDDGHLVQAAYWVVRNELTEHEAWDYRLISEDQHDKKTCDRCRPLPPHPAFNKED